MGTDAIIKIVDALMLETGGGKTQYWLDRFGKSIGGMKIIVSGLHIWEPSFFRIRKHKPEEDGAALVHENGIYQYRNLTDLWYPSSQKISGGRANLPFERRLYVSSTAECCIKESDLREGDTFTLATISAKNAGQWQAIKPVFIGFIRHKSAYPDQYSQEEKTATKNSDAYQYLSNAFIEDHQRKEYPFTQILSSYLFRIAEMKCLCYPSVRWPMGSAYLNYAFKADVADEFLEISSMQHCIMQGSGAYRVLL